MLGYERLQIPERKNAAMGGGEGRSSVYSGVDTLPDSDDASQ